MADRKKPQNKRAKQGKGQKSSASNNRRKVASQPRQKPVARSRRRSRAGISKPWVLIQPFLFFLAAIALLALLLWVVLLDHQVREKFEGKRWAIPAKVYARPLELYAGLALSPDDLLAELQRLHYRQTDFTQLLEEGQYAMQVSGPGQLRVRIRTRGFDFSDGGQSSEEVLLHFREKQLSASSHALVRLEPQLIGGIYPSHNEDRVLIQLEQTPPLLIETLLMVEDREFFNHYGVSPKAIARAALVNVFSGGVRQGGSTLTQQLVKNFYLTNERSLTRKINEALMALLLEAHYSKQEVLEAYLNEVNLGQMGKRGIHGFGLAAQHYFGRDIEKLDVHQVALLVALVKGPSFYEPRRNPERALERRNLILGIMAEHGFITAEEALVYQGKTLELTEKSYLQHQTYPAFLQLVKQQLQAEYSTEDLQSEGLRIFTSLDPVVQTQAQRSVAETLGRLRNGAAPDLQAAFLAIAPDSGEVLALVAGVDAHNAGFNRVLDARRSIGSLVKPAVYLTALKRKQWHWASLLDDSPVFVDSHGRVEADPSADQEGLWSPQNFDKQVHGDNGQVTMLEAMSRSYNQATVRLGLGLGLDSVITTLHALGISARIGEYPSTLLGTLELSPFEVTQMYQTIASGGFNTPIKVIREVQDARGQTLSRYPFNIRQVLDTQMAYLIHEGLREVVRSGTARSLNDYLPDTLALAGKTGTSGEQRDSWFVGYGDNLLATVWIGNDDNTPTPYTGASAALKVWTHFVINFPLVAGARMAPEGVEWAWIEPKSQLLADETCQGAVHVPILLELLPEQDADCVRSAPSKLRKLFGF